MKPTRPVASRTTGGRTTGGRSTGGALGRKTQKIRWGDDNTPINSDDARGRIVAAALDCVTRFGVDKTGMDDVAKAAAITRPTVYKYFPTRNQLMMAVFLRALDDRLDRGLQDFFKNATTVDELRDGVADAAAYMLGVLRSDETVQNVLFGSRIPVEDLLNETATVLVGVMQVGLEGALETAIAHDLVGSLRPFSLDEAASWIIRILYSFLVWPGTDAEAERATFRSYLAPVFFTDPA